MLSLRLRVVYLQVSPGCTHMHTTASTHSHPGRLCLTLEALCTWRPKRPLACFMCKLHICCEHAMAIHICSEHFSIVALNCNLLALRSGQSSLRTSWIKNTICIDVTLISHDVQADKLH